MSSNDSVHRPRVFNMELMDMLSDAFKRDDDVIYYYQLPYW